MPKELEPSNNEKHFILESLSQGKRLDGRDLNAFRPLELELGEEYGLADVRLGKTRCVLFLFYFLLSSLPGGVWRRVKRYRALTGDGMVFL